MQRRDPGAFLWDAHEAALAIQSFTSGMDETQYIANEMAQAAVERKFEIMGEALNSLNQLDPARGALISNLSEVVNFRNQLIHGYAAINVSTVWNVVQNNLPDLVSNLKSLLDDLGPPEV